jgi:hypothetical protein
LRIFSRKRHALKSQKALPMEAPFILPQQSSHRIDQCRVASDTRLKTPLMVRFYRFASAERDIDRAPK